MKYGVIIIIFIIMSIPCVLRLKKAWFIVPESGLQQVATGPRSLFSFVLQGQYFS